VVVSSSPPALFPPGQVWVHPPYFLFSVYELKESRQPPRVTCILLPTTCVWPAGTVSPLADWPFGRQTSWCNISISERIFLFCPLPIPPFPKTSPLYSVASAPFLVGCLVTDLSLRGVSFNSKDRPPLLRSQSPATFFPSSIRWNPQFYLA